MKKRFLLLIPITLMLIFGLAMIPANAQGVTDAENDLQGYHGYTEGGNPVFDCDWVPEINTTIDIKAIDWEDVDGNYTITMEFWGEITNYIRNYFSVNPHCFKLTKGNFRN